MPLKIKVRAIIIITLSLTLLLYCILSGIMNKSLFHITLFFIFLSLSLLFIYLFIPQIKIGNEIRRGKRGKVYLTFDDGPIEPYTSKILDILKENNVRATFFVVGRKAKEYPHLLERMYKEGHTIGNHTFNHRILTLMSKKRALDEIKRCEEVISEITGNKPKFFRSPHGFRRPFMRKLMEKLGYKLVTWTKGIWDTAPSSKEELLKRVSKKIKDGEILLLHDGNPFSYQTVEILPKIIEEYRKRGLSFDVIDNAV